jgi:hypothetical protein
MNTYTYTQENVSFQFTKEQITKLKDAMTKAEEIADAVDSCVNLDGNYTGAINAIYFCLAPEFNNCPDFYNYDDVEPFIEWFTNLQLEV